MQYQDELDEEKKKKLYDTLQAKYQRAADTSDVDEVVDSAAWKNTGTHIGEALEGFARAKSQARGGQGVDSGFYKGVRDSVESGVKDARQKRKDRIDITLTEDSIDWQSKERGRKEGEWERQDSLNASADALTARENDPSSQESQMAQMLANKLMPGRDFSTRSAAQLKSALPTLEKIYAIEQRKLAKGGEKKLSPAETKKRGLAIIGEKAEDQYDTAVKSGKSSGDYDPTSKMEFIDNSSWAPNWMKSDESIEARASMSSWVDSYLRDESGAAIPEDERDSYFKIYFPQPGDTSTAVANKKALREQKMNNARSAGRMDPMAPQSEAPAKKPKHGSELP